MQIARTIKAGYVTDTTITGPDGAVRWPLTLAQIPDPKEPRTYRFRVERTDGGIEFEGALFARNLGTAITKVRDTYNLWEPDRESWRVRVDRVR